MLLKDISPFVRIALRATMNASTSDSFKFVQTMDCRLFYITDGEGSIVIEDKEYPLKPQTAVLLHSGTKYMLKPDGVMKTLIINFDHTENFAHCTQSFRPFTEKFPGALESVSFSDAEALNAPVVFPRAEAFESRLHGIVNAYFDKTPFRSEYLSASLKAVIIGIARALTDEKKELSESSQLVRDIVKYLKNNYSENIGNESLAERFHFTSVYINRIFKKEMGISVHQYLIRLRIDIAKDMLRACDYTATEIASFVGFDDFPHFSKTFKRITGKTPLEYRASTNESRIVLPNGEASVQ